jgi:LysR family transcriptional regulator, transcriptional activator for dmlA
VNDWPLLDDLRVFRTAARLGSFIATANELGVSPAFVSKRIAILETRLHVKLFHRTSRRVAITDEGETVYAWVQRVSDDVDEMMEAVAAAKSSPEGMIRISTSFGLGRNYVAPVLSELRRRHPALEIRLDLFDRAVDLIAEDIDIDIRVGDVPEPNLIAHRIVASSRILCASPMYLEKHAEPRTLADLAQHACLVIHERDQSFGVWRLYGPAGLETVKVTSPMSSNHGDIVRTWAIEGHGIMLRAIWDVAESLAAGQLVRVLPSYRQSAEVWAVSPVRLSSSGKVRVCVRFLQEQLQRGEFALPGPHSE